MAEKIDLVLPWVDGCDHEWQKQKSKYDSSVEENSGGANRYRDWDMLIYLFRGIEKFLPWVRKVHFITCGHLPDWLNTGCEKLNIVKHNDYIPDKYLPTFSSHPIELNMFRIDDLTEQFIYLNDDTFFTGPLEEKDFFVNGLPKDCALVAVHQFKKEIVDHIIANDLGVINENFNKFKSIFKNITKWFSLKYGKVLIKNLYFLPTGNFVGFELKHIPQAYLKSTLKEVWEKEYEVLDRTSSNKFRSRSDVNQWLFRYWQIASGNFVPEKTNKGKFFIIGKDDGDIKQAIIQQKYKMICLSDDIIDIDFESEKKKICSWFDEILPNKSMFEK